MDKIPLYSPIQAALASFFGGPFAAIYVVWKNFAALGREAAARQTMLWGAVLIVVMLIVMPILPDWFPNFAIPAAILGAVVVIVQQHQMSKEAIQASETYGFQSNWNVAGISIGFLTLFFVIAIAWMFGLDAAGIIKL